MKTQDNIGVVFVNTIVGRGTLNGVVNLSFGTFNFTPSDDGKVVDIDPVISCRLRMDKICLKQLRDVADELLSIVEKADSHMEPGAPIEGLLPKQRPESVN